MGTRQLHTRDRLVLQACIEKELSLQDSCKRLGFSGVFFEKYLKILTFYIRIMYA